jgi:putative transcriptional regulator
MTSENAKDDESGYLSGKLLIATPSIGDTRFDHSVVLMCDHLEQAGRRPTNACCT